MTELVNIVEQCGYENITLGTIEYGGTEREKDRIRDLWNEFQSYEPECDAYFMDFLAKRGWIVHDTVDTLIL